MEYIVILLLLSVIVILAFRQPNKIKEIVINSTIEEIKKNEAEIVNGVYSRLPESLREKVDSKTVAELVSFALNVGLDIVESELKKDE